MLRKCQGFGHRIEGVGVKDCEGVGHQCPGPPRERPDDQLEIFENESNSVHLAGEVIVHEPGEGMQPPHGETKVEKSRTG